MKFFINGKAREITGHESDSVIQNHYIGKKLITEKIIKSGFGILFNCCMKLLHTNKKRTRILSLFFFNY